MEVLTIARYSRERDVHVHGQLLSSAPVDHNRGIHIDAAVVEEFNGSKREDDRRSDNGHLRDTMISLRTQRNAESMCAKGGECCKTESRSAIGFRIIGTLVQCTHRKQRYLGSPATLCESIRRFHNYSRVSY